VPGEVVVVSTSEAQNIKESQRDVYQHVEMHGKKGGCCPQCTAPKVPVAGAYGAMKTKTKTKTTTAGTFGKMMPKATKMMSALERTTKSPYYT
jgi:hypothetical protein